MVKAPASVLWIACLLFLGSLHHSQAADEVVETPVGEPETLPAVELTKAEQFFQRAVEIRDFAAKASEKDLQRAVELLYAAAGIEHLSMSKEPAALSETTSETTQNESSNNDTSLPSESTITREVPYLTSKAVTVKFRNGTIQHEGAVRELIYIFRDGDGAPMNPAIAHRLLEELASHGNPEAQADVATYLALGLEPVAANSKGHIFKLTSPDVPAALVYYFFAAKAGDPIAQMALGYRHFKGYDVPKSCKTAALYYAPVAERVLEQAKIYEGLPEQQAFRLSHRTAHARAKPSAEQEYLHYKWFADYGHADAARAVAHLLAHGAAPDYAEAVRYLEQAAGAGDIDAMAHLGHMYANGIAVRQDNSTAWRWFWRAAEKGHPSGMFGLGYMHLSGQGADVNHKQAFEYFRQAVEGGKEWTGLGDGLFFLATMYLKGWGTVSDMGQAAAYFQMSARSGNLLAAYNLAVLHLREAAGEKGDAACKAAVNELKRVAERGWPALSEGADDFSAGDYEWALLNFAKAAEWGSELGQSNAAWMLQEGYGYDGPQAGEVAVRLLQRAAEQGNAAALVRLGDAFWYGKGVSRDWARAGSVYTEAARHRVAQALFNLGFMHQHGAGVPQDFLLAKRYYDQASEAAPDAKFASAIALGVLRAHRWWRRVEPGLPRRLEWLWKGLLAVREESGPALRAHPSSPHGVWGRVRCVFSLSTVIDALDALDASFDVTLVTWLLGLLGLVLWRRAALRARQTPVVATPVPVPAAAAAAPTVVNPTVVVPPVAQVIGEPQQQEVEGTRVEEESVPDDSEELRESGSNVDGRAADGDSPAE